MVLAEPGGGITILFQDLGDSGALRTNDRIIARVAGGQFADHAVADRVVVTAGNQRCTRRRAKRSGVELRVAEPGLGNPIQVRRRNDTAKSAGDAIALVISHDEEHVGSALWRHDARWPPGRRILGAFFDHSAKFGWRCRELLTVDG